MKRYLHYYRTALLSALMLMALASANATRYYIMRDTTVPGSWYETYGTAGVVTVLGMEGLDRTRPDYDSIVAQKRRDENRALLKQTFDKAKAGDEIWVQGFNHFNIEYEYTVPLEGLTLKSGVKLYGGFNGSEQTLDEREYVDGKRYKFKYRTLLSGDTHSNDVIIYGNSIFPYTDGSDLNKRAGNADHVLILDMTPTEASGNNNNMETVVNGLTIARGHAIGTYSAADDMGGRKGGGIYVCGDNSGGGRFRIEQCFFSSNYASYGGAIYVGDGVKTVTDGDNMIDHCLFLNNAAGERLEVANRGAAVYVAGAVTIVNTVLANNTNGAICANAEDDKGTANVFNCTVTRNVGPAVDCANRSISVYNTVIWGNTSPTTSAATRPILKNSACLLSDVASTDGNVYLNSRNRASDGPFFSNPSPKKGFDHSFNLLETLYPAWGWEPTEVTTLVDNGDNSHYDIAEYGNIDMNNSPRVRNTTIDIGAYEYQPTDKSRIRYVKPTALGTADGKSWANASSDLQAMINDLADGGGEVWITGGHFSPKANLDKSKAYTASFRMRDGVSVYGGFAGTEEFREERYKNKVEDGMPWEYQESCTTVLEGAGYSGTPTWGNNELGISSESRHVVWFAPMPLSDPAFTTMTYLDGVTIRGGNAQGGNGVADFHTDRGGGVYMHGLNVTLRDCVVRDNAAQGNGGAVYVDMGGQVRTCLMYNNNADGNGGAVYLDGMGLVLRSMLTNNYADDGAGIYMRGMEAGEDPENHPDGYPTAVVASTNVITNNTARNNAALYCHAGGVLLHNTIANNLCPKSTDEAHANTSQTGGLYIDKWGLVINSVLWNNRFGTSDPRDIPMYVRNANVAGANIRFFSNAISGFDNAVWNYTTQMETLTLSSSVNGAGTVTEPDFFTRDDLPAGEQDSYKPTNYVTDEQLNKNYGVRPEWAKIDYFWEPAKGTVLWSRGRPLGLFPDEVALAPEIDIKGDVFAQKPTLGAFHGENSAIVPSVEGTDLVLYISPDHVEKTNDGSSWQKPYRSINGAVNYFSTLTNGMTITALQGSTYNTSYRFSTANINRLVIRVTEGDLWPRYFYTEEDVQSATHDFLAMASGLPLRAEGGWYLDDVTDKMERSPLDHRSVLNGNPDAIEKDDIVNGYYHVATVETGATVELDGFHIVNGYAADMGVIQQGAGVYAYPGSDVTITGCVFEDNMAVTAAAVYGDKVTMNNCVVNNNTNTTPTASVVEATDLTLNHVTFVNNIGTAPANLGTTSFAAHNASNAAGTVFTGANNNVDVPTIGKEGANHFVNPANDMGAVVGFDTYLGGYAEYRPLTSANAKTGPIINKAKGSTLTQDITGNDRDLGGVADLGAYEADLPKKGSIIYVRSYNTADSSTGEELDGTPDWDLLTKNPGVVFDGSSWDTAIHGNAICNLNNEMGSNNIYVRSNGALLSATVDRTTYSSTYNNSTARYGTRSKFYGKFFNNGETNQYEMPGNAWNTYCSVHGRYENIITNNRDEIYVSGLQYAVEKAAAKNKSLAVGEDSVVVWVGGGIYTDYKGFVIRDGVKVYGGFPKTGNPGENDRRALLTRYAPANDAYKDLKTNDYETILQIRKETPVTWSGNTPTAQKIVTDLTSGQHRHYVLYQPDVCLPTWAPDNDAINSYTGGNTYRYPGNGFGYEDDRHYVEYKGASWDGFTVRHGYIKGATSNRDGGPGIRCFRGVKLENMVVVNNYNYADRSRGGGLYMDGLNSVIFNSFLLNNMSGGDEAYGGGAYMIVGTGYNMAVANNFANSNGGGLFIESATFYNNTVAYNKSGSNGTGNGAGITQWSASSSLSNLLLYNCLFYGNEGANTIRSQATSTFEVPHNCYVQGSVSGKDDNSFPNKFSGNGNSLGSSLPNPFDATNAQSTNDYRLKSSSACVNAGTVIIPGVTLPATDADFTDRVKDCAIDIGAYELYNIENTKPTTTTSGGKTTAVYYVTQNGAGTSSGADPGNAACAEKLQTVLTAAGNYKESNPTHDVVVKIAGYEDELDADGNVKTKGFSYHANTLADPDDPQSYSYTIPYGVTVSGGYYAGTYTNGKYNKDGTWDKADGERDITKYKTRLNAVKLATATTQEVKGYHVVTFGEKPDGWTGGDQQTLIDGLYLEGGSATSLAGAGSPKTRGGGAIVPEWAHVRNCVVRDNEAMFGGGLYVMPGATVSGCFLTNNTADRQGGAMYVDNDGLKEGCPAYIVSCTMAANNAEQGGGVYVEDGAAIFLNCVIFGNNAAINKNAKADFYTTATSEMMQSLFGSIDKWYPFNDCYVESAEIPGNFSNTMMRNDKDTYFNPDNNYIPKSYSLLISHGMSTYLQAELVKELGIAEYDMRGVQRIDTPSDDSSPIDVGAYAVKDDKYDVTKLVKRLFVSLGTSTIVDPNAAKFTGQSFYTPFTWLGDAMEYIEAVRKDATNGAEARATTFEVFMAAGTYKPRRRRDDAASDIEDLSDKRQNSFVIPYNVKIYGGFTGEEKIFSNAEGVQDINKIQNVLTILSLNDADEITLSTDAEIKTMLDAREHADFNGNNILEPWDMAHRTILSGAVDVSGTQQNVYHVVYSSRDNGTTAPEKQGVTLDGVTVMEGYTLPYLYKSGSTQNTELGRGAGVYSSGIDYTVVNSRFINNHAVLGGGIFVRDADVTSVNSLFSGCTTIDDHEHEAGNALYSAGGGIYASLIEAGKTAAVNAVNTLFANNSSAGTGAAIVSDGTIDLMNNTIVNNLTASGPAVFLRNGTALTMVNTLMWHNVAENNDSIMTLNGTVMPGITYSASDVNYNSVMFDESGTSNTNHWMSAVNMDLTGPRLESPTAGAGAQYNDLVSSWNPMAQSPLTDTGSGKIKPEVDERTLADADYEGNSQAYKKWFEDKGLTYYMFDYMGKDNDTAGNDGVEYKRYSGPTKEDGSADYRPIDIGLYEYQYHLEFSRMDAIYVAPFGRRKANGTNWMNATDDLRGAIIGAANPKSNIQTNDGVRRVFIAAGEYKSPLALVGSTYTLSTSSPAGIQWNTLEIVGSCSEMTKILNIEETQDFSKPTVLRNYPDVQATQLLDINSADKNVIISGITFANNAEKTSGFAGGNGISVSNIGEDATLTLENVALRGNTNNGISIDDGHVDGKMLLVNMLFADNDNLGLNAGTATSLPDANVTLVNTTFANNGTDMNRQLTRVYNSTSWNNATQLMTAADGHNNKVFDLMGTTPEENNEDIGYGPRFRDPLNADVMARDYRIRPSFTLLNLGSNGHYLRETGEAPDTVVDLHNVKRRIGDYIDIGAYEYETDLGPIVYVKPDLLGSDLSGHSWDNAMSDLQDAVDLAGLYVRLMGKAGTNAYVFVHHETKDSEKLDVHFDGVKVYGGMIGETTSLSLNDAGTTPEMIVDSLLAKRVGLLERESLSELNGGLDLDAWSVVDGFKITSTAGKPVTVGRGTLSTSVVEGDVTGDATEGTLYNTLLDGSAKGLKTVNVTATGTVPATAGSGNNRTYLATTNKQDTITYLANPGLWKYQLMETSTDIDVADADGNRGRLTQQCMDSVGHNRDVAGNRRIRNTVDNGCFETWNITPGMAAGNIVAEEDYPHGRSVVYVRTRDDKSDGAELLITKGYTDGMPFNPGFLLLEHRAGLRGNGRSVELTNFAVERWLASGTDLAVMPFNVTDVEGSATISLYDAAARAGYGYKFSATDGSWTSTPASVERNPLTTGWLLEGAAGDKVRFFGNSYSEDKLDTKYIRLQKYNYNDPWTSTASTGNKFTHKENMSWNLFGSPYLCAMNYSDMAYGRVLYAGADGSYVTIDAVENGSADGYIPAGDAVFTQTATLRQTESLAVAAPTEANMKSGVPFARAKALYVALTGGGRTRGGAVEDGDRLQLKAVPADEARTDFDVNGDGVKWMAPNRAPQIYAEQGGGRYSLLSAVSVDGEVHLGLTLPEAGTYTIAIPDDCMTDGYEAVMLNDKATGSRTDLLDGAYTFTAGEGDITGRFTITFVGGIGDVSDSSVRVSRSSRDKVRLVGTLPGDRITVYSASGVAIDNRIAASETETLSAPVGGIAIVEVVREGNTQVVKVR